MTDRITFKCNDCGQTVMGPVDRTPDDDEIISCTGCGRTFGPYSQVRQAMIEASKKALDDLVMSKLGAKPTWTKT